MTEAASSRPRASDRATVERTVRDLILGVVEQRVPAGTSIVLEGAPGIGKTFLARMRALGIRRGSREAHRDTDHGWASLTAAEIRIAALVREGLTNREIGTRLFVSPRTVQVHVSHILQKTGLRSRVEIARSAGA